MVRLVENSAKMGTYFWKYYRDLVPESLGVRIRGFGFSGKGSLAPQPPRRILDCYCLSYVHRGQCLYQSPFHAPRRVGEGTVILSFPGIWHHYEYLPEKDWEEYWVLFEGHLIDHFYEKQIFNEKASLLPHGRDKILLGAFDGALRHARLENPTSQDALLAAFFQIFNRIFHIPLQKLNLKSKNPVQALLNRVAHDLKKNWDLKNEANRLGVPYETFRKQVKELTGKSPVQWLNQKKIYQGCRLLSEGISVKEACHQLGFGDPYHFSRMFKKITGRSPKAFSLAITKTK